MGAGQGNKRQVTYHYDGSNQLTNVQNASGATIIGLGYDARGNVVNKNGRVLDFDYGNRLRGIDGFAAYVYDGLGRRVRDTTSGGIKYSLYSHPGQLLYANDQRRGLETEYVYLGGSLIATREQPLGGSTYTTRYQHTDALGSLVAVTDSGRQVVERSQYAPYGTLLNRPVSDGPGYTGHVMDAATGLTYMQQRYYDPELPRFLSADPVLTNPNTGANFNRYWYARNNPYGFTDPDGRLSVANTSSRVGASSASGNYAVNSIQAGWSIQKRILAADNVIRQVTDSLNRRKDGNTFGSFDSAAEFLRGRFAKVGTYLQLEFGGVSKPISHGITGLSRSQFPTDFNSDMIGIRVDPGPIPAGGADFHTHPNMRHPFPMFSGGDLDLALRSEGRYSYVFYGYSTYAAKKLDIKAAQAAGVGASDPEVYKYISDFTGGPK